MYKPFLLFSNLIVLCCSVLFLLPAAGAPARTKQQRIEYNMQAYISERGEDHVLPELQAKLRAGDFVAAEQLATAAIEQPESPSNRQYQAYVRSMAFIGRGMARFRAHEPDALIIPDFVSAARLGNVAAVRALLERSFSKSGDEYKRNEPALAGVDIDEIVAIGVDLNDALALKIAAQDTPGGRYTEQEKRLYGMLFDLQSHELRMADTDRYERDYKNNLIPRDTFLVGGIIPAAAQLPGRDMVATLFAEQNLRSVIARGLGSQSPTGPPKIELTLRDTMEVNRFLFESSGVTYAYGLITEDPKLGEGFIVMDLKSILKEIAPGDSINVRCGALAHTATVFTVDLPNDRITLADPLFQFWEPAKNGCIEYFRQTHFKYGFYLTELKLSEVAAILDSTQTLRSYRVPSIVNRAEAKAGAGKNSVCQTREDRDAGILGLRPAAAEPHDLFKWFNFHEATHLLPGANPNLLVYVQPVEVRASIVLTLEKNSLGCIGSASLYLRRDYMHGLEAMLAKDLYRSFLAAGLGSSAMAQLDTRLTSPKGARALQEVLVGKMRQIEHTLPDRFVRIESVVADSGAEWVKFTVR